MYSTSQASVLADHVSKRMLVLRPEVSTVHCGRFCTIKAATGSLVNITKHTFSSTGNSDGCYILLLLLWPPWLDEGEGASVCCQPSERMDVAAEAGSLDHRGPVVALITRRDQMHLL